MTSEEISAMKPLGFSTASIAEAHSLVSGVGQNPCMVSGVGWDCSLVTGVDGGP